MTEWNLDSIIRLCAEAGNIALRHFDRPTTDYKSDESVVTEADRGIEAHLSRSFDQPATGSRLLGEETISTRDEDYLAGLLRETGWIVDPIDGTVLYANHLDGWGISIGYMRDGVIEEGVVYFPLSGELYISDAEKVFAGTMIAGQANRDELELRELPPPRGAYAKSGIVAVTQELTKSREMPFTNPVYAGGSAVLPLMSLLQGRMMAYVGQLKVWDLAGSLPLLLRLGAIVTLDDGTPVDGGVSESVYLLQPKAEKRFSVRENLIISFDEEAHAIVQEALDAVAEPA